MLKLVVAIAKMEAKYSYDILISCNFFRNCPIRLFWFLVPLWLIVRPVAVRSRPEQPPNVSMTFKFQRLSRELNRLHSTIK